MKHLFCALMLCLVSIIIIGCSNINEPQSPTPDESVKWDTAFTDVYLKIYVSPIVYEYCDLEFFRIDENGDSVRLESEEITMDTLGADTPFYNYYKSFVKECYPPLDSIKVFQTTEKLTVNNAINTECRVVAVRNSNKLDLQGHKIYYVNASVLVPDDQTLYPSLNFGYSGYVDCNYLDLDYLDLGTDEKAEKRYNSLIIYYLENLCKWSIRYYVSI